MKRIAAAVAAAGLALAGCSGADSNSDKPATSGDPASQEAKHTQVSTEDLRQALTDAGLNPSKVDSSNADANDLLDSLSIDPPECQALLNVAQEKNLGLGKGLSAKSDSATFFASANEDGKDMGETIDFLNEQADKCSTMSVTFADIKVDSEFTRDDIKVDNAEATFAGTTNLKTGDQDITITTISAVKGNVFVSAMVNQGSTAEDASKTLAKIFGNL